MIFHLYFLLAHFYNLRIIFCFPIDVETVIQTGLTFDGDCRSTLEPSPRPPDTDLQLQNPNMPHVFTIDGENSRVIVDLFPPVLVVTTDREDTFYR